MTTPTSDEDYALAFDRDGNAVDPASPEAYEVEFFSQGRHIVGIGPAHPDHPGADDGEA